MQAVMFWGLCKEIQVYQSRVFGVFRVNNFWRFFEGILKIITPRSLRFLEWKNGLSCSQGILNFLDSTSLKENRVYNEHVESEQDGDSETRRWHEVATQRKGHHHGQKLSPLAKIFLCLVLVRSLAAIQWLLFRPGLAIGSRIGSQCS